MQASNHVLQFSRPFVNPIEPVRLPDSLRSCKAIQPLVD